MQKGCDDVELNQLMNHHDVNKVFMDENYRTCMNQNERPHVVLTYNVGPMLNHLTILSNTSTKTWMTNYHEDWDLFYKRNTRIGIILTRNGESVLEAQLTRMSPWVVNE